MQTFVYRQHLDTPLGDPSRPHMSARHYTGKAVNWQARDAEHRNGTGARMLAAANAAGIRYHVETVYACATPQLAHQLEQWLKARGHASSFCAHCQAVARGETPPSEIVVVQVNSLADVAKVRRPVEETIARRMARLALRNQRKASSIRP